LWLLYLSQVYENGGVEQQICVQHSHSRQSISSRSGRHASTMYPVLCSQTVWCGSSRCYIWSNWYNRSIICLYCYVLTFSIHTGAHLYATEPSGNHLPSSKIYQFMNTSRYINFEHLNLQSLWFINRQLLWVLCHGNRIAIANFSNISWKRVRSTCIRRMLTGRVDQTRSQSSGSFTRW